MGKAEEEGEMGGTWVRKLEKSVVRKPTISFSLIITENDSIVNLQDYSQYGLTATDGHGILSISG